MSAARAERKVLARRQGTGELLALYTLCRLAVPDVGACCVVLGTREVLFVSEDERGDDRVAVALPLDGELRAAADPAHPTVAVLESGGQGRITVLAASRAARSDLLHSLWAAGAGRLEL